MTYRELELFIQGQEDHRKWVRRNLAWMQTNLMNIHIPKGKPKVKLDQLLPKEDRVKSDDSSDLDMLDRLSGPSRKEDALKKLRTASEKAKAQKEQKDWDEFISSHEGKRYLAMVGDEE